MRIPYGDNYIAVASIAPTTHPAWYRNLTAHPHLSVQDGAQVRALRAREVFGEEKNRGAVAEQYWPHFPEYRAQAGTRDIPVLVLEPRNNGEG